MTSTVLLKPIQSTVAFIKTYLDCYFKAKEALKWKYCPNSTHSCKMNPSSFLAVSFHHCSPFLYVCISLMCFLFKPGLRCFSHIFAAISSGAVSTPDLFAAASKKMALFAVGTVCSAPSLNNSSFLTVVSRTCVYGGCVYLHT